MMESDLENCAEKTQKHTTVESGVQSPLTSPKPGPSWDPTKLSWVRDPGIEFLEWKC